jgi:hypothetical protein
MDRDICHVDALSCKCLKYYVIQTAVNISAMHACHSDDAVITASVNTNNVNNNNVYPVYLYLLSGVPTCGANHDTSRKALLVHWPTAFLNAEFPTDSPSPLVSCLPVDGNDNSLYNDA